MGNHEKRIAGREMIGSVWQSIMVMSDEMHNAFPFRKCTYQFFLQKRTKIDVGGDECKINIEEENPT